MHFITSTALSLLVLVSAVSADRCRNKKHRSVSSPEPPAVVAAPLSSVSPSIPMNATVPLTSKDEIAGGSLDGTKFAKFLDCFADYLPNASHRADNSKTSGCDEKTIKYCKTDAGHDDKMCLWDGTNKLVETKDTPECYLNCQMESCNAWGDPKPEKMKCLDLLK